tara:strand:+ start:2980 stop:3225 length:246 start_codon:yes stop_codon:yes gene_type:complete
MALQTSTHSAGAIRAITPADATDLPLQGCRAIHVGVAGNISIVDLGGITTVITDVAAGILPVQAKGVNATGTTATGLIALY